MTQWKRGVYSIDQKDSPKKAVRGLVSDTFGIRFEQAIGFRITHLPSGLTISPQFFRRLKDAVAFCDDIRPVLDWQNLTAEQGWKMRDQVIPVLTEKAKRYHRYALTSFGLVDIPPEYAEAA